MLQGTTLARREPNEVGGQAPRLRVAFVVSAFPLVSETFIIDQVAYLLDRGIDVEIFSFTRGDRAFVSQKYFDYDMAAREHHLDYPLGKFARALHAAPRILRLGRRHPRILLRALNVFKYGRSALALKLLYWSQPLAGRNFDLVHCHFGTAANDFVLVRDVLELDAPMVTTFYGVDVSKIFRDRPADYYDPLKRACSLFFVMSRDMKRRVVEHGFPAEQVRVHPVSIEVERYPFQVRSLLDGEPLRLVAVGRFVEKKGFDDLLRAVALARERSTRPITCSIVGGGPLEPELRALSSSLGLDDIVRFEGFMPIEEVIGLFSEKHVLVTPSKTAANGDME